MRNEPDDLSELPPVAYQCSAPDQFVFASSTSIIDWSPSSALCSVTSEPGMYEAIGCSVHAAVVAFSRAPLASCSAPTCAHVTPRHAYVSSNAAFTSVKLGKVPASYSPNLVWLLIVCAALGLQWCTSGSTAAPNVAPSAAFFCERPVPLPIFHA